jgi:hypothetical protein
MNATAMTSGGTSGSTGSRSDLLSRLSNFLPQIQAANAQLLLDAKGSVDNDADAAIDGGLQLVLEGESDESDDDVGDDETSDGDDDKLHSQQRRPSKQRKISSDQAQQQTVVLNLHVTSQDNPLFQSLHENDDHADEKHGRAVHVCQPDGAETLDDSTAIAAAASSCQSKSLDPSTSNPLSLLVATGRGDLSRRVQSSQAPKDCPRPLITVMDSVEDDSTVNE